MAIWGVRAGRYGGNESYAIDNSVVVIGWDDLGDLDQCDNRQQIAKLIANIYKDVKPTTLPIWTGEFWAFKNRIQEGRCGGPSRTPRGNANLRC